MQFAVEGLREGQGVVVAGVVVAVEYDIHLVEAARPNAFVQVAFFEQMLGVLHYLNGSGSLSAGLHFHIGGVQLVRGADFFEVQRFGFAAFGDDQDARVSGAAFVAVASARELSRFGLVVSPHQCLTPSDWLRRKGRAP